jgi:pheromone shutdown protein TraB
MLKVIIIGTLHAGLTPSKELETEFTKYNPNQILVEIAESDIKNKNISKYPPEMIFTYNWARKNKIKVKGFDSRISIFKKGIKKADNLELIKKQKKIIKNYSWKAFNKKENDKLLNIDDLSKIIDLEKEKIRRSKMLSNIKKFMITEGVVMIITGSGHLNFFEKYFKKAIFPFR